MPEPPRLPGPGVLDAGSPGDPDNGEGAADVLAPLGCPAPLIGSAELLTGALPPGTGDLGWAGFLPRVDRITNSTTTTISRASPPASHGHTDPPPEAR